jgi:hypothetical protein
MHTNIESLEIFSTPLSEFMRPAFDPKDYDRVQESIKECIYELRDLAPALSTQQKIEITRLIGFQSGQDVMTIDEVTQQYQLVLRIRDMVLDPDNSINEKTDPRGLTALVNAISNLINLFLRHKDKIDHMKEIAHMREAVVTAMGGQSVDVRKMFFDKLDELNGK